MAKVIVKARKSYECLDDVEKVQFEAFVQQSMLIHYRGFRTADESAFLIGAEELRGRIKAHARDRFLCITRCLRMLQNSNAAQYHTRRTLVERNPKIT